MDLTPLCLLSASLRIDIRNKQFLMISLKMDTLKTLHIIICNSFSRNPSGLSLKTVNGEFLNLQNTGQIFV